MQLLAKSKKLTEGSILEVLVGRNGVYVVTSFGTNDIANNSIALYSFKNLDIAIAKVVDIGEFDTVPDPRSGQNLSLAPNGDVLITSRTKATMFTSTLTFKWAVKFDNSDGKLANTPITNMVEKVRSSLVLANGKSLVSTAGGKILIDSKGVVILGVKDTSETALAYAFEWGGTLYQLGSTTGVWKVNLTDLSTSIVFRYTFGDNQNGVRFSKISADGFLYVSQSGDAGTQTTIAKYDLNTLKFVWSLSSKFIDSKNLPSVSNSNYCALAVDDMGYIYAANEAYTMMVTENLVLKGYEVNI